MSYAASSGRRPLARLARLAAAVSLVAGFTLPATVEAAGFSAPVAVSGNDDTTGTHVAAISPTGRTAVVYERYVNGNYRRTQQRLLIGDTPERLGLPRTLTFPGAPAGARYEAPQLVARADGGFVLCVTRATRTGRIQGCSVAPPGKAFGPLVALPKPVQALRPIARPDGSTLLLRTRQRSTTDGRISFIGSTMAVLSADGTLGPLRPMPRTDEEMNYNGALTGDGDTAVVADGTVAIRANGQDPNRRDGTVLGVRLLPPGAATFGPVIPVPGTLSDNNIQLLGGPHLTISFAAATGKSFDGSALRVIQRLADGTFGPVRSVPNPNSSYYGGIVSSALGVLPDGDLFAVTARTEYDDRFPDCDYLRSGVVGTSGLTPISQQATETRLSTKGQVSLAPQAAGLSDGTAIASWQDGLGESGARRVVTAIRAPGAASFDRVRRLPAPASSDAQPTLVAAGTHAALLWLHAGGTDDHDRLVVSTLRPVAPYAPQAPVARHPGTSCE